MGFADGLIWYWAMNEIKLVEKRRQENSPKVLPERVAGLPDGRMLLVFVWAKKVSQKLLGKVLKIVKAFIALKDLQHTCKKTNQTQVNVALATGLTRNREFPKPPRNQAATRRGLACFLGRRFAVPESGCVRFAPFSSETGLLHRKRYEKN
jgi:hypothetical protein